MIKNKKKIIKNKKDERKLPRYTGDIHTFSKAQKQKIKIKRTNLTNYDANIEK